MRVLFLGTSSAVPSAEDGYTAFVVSSQAASVLVDTGDNPVRSLREAGINPFELDAAVITHHHVDHLGSLPSLVSALDCMNRKKPLTIAAKGVTLEKIRRLFEVFEIDPEKLTFPILFAEGFETKTMTVSLLSGNHSVPTQMVRFTEGASGLHYSSDYRHGSDPVGIVKIAEGCTSLIHEATYPQAELPDRTGHSSALQAGRAAKASGVNQLFLCHLYHDAYLADSQAEDEARLAFDGEIISPKLLVWYNVL